MKQEEKLLYSLMGAISKTDAPVVFKGALITKLVLAENGYTVIERMTRDIDANWTADPPTMDTLVDEINEHLGKLHNNRFYAVATRGYGEKRSAGLIVLDRIENDDVVFTMDISMKPDVGSRIYSYGNMTIKGVLPNEIIADKLCVMSDKSIFRRSKDLIDVYALSHCMSIKTSDIFNICDVKGRQMGDFKPFFNQKDNLEHAYNKLQGVDNKPNFENLYLHLSSFIQPFVQRDLTQVWGDGVYTPIGPQQADDLRV